MSYESIFLKVMSNIQYGKISIEMPDGKIHNFTGNEDGQIVSVKIKDTKAIKHILLDQDIGLGESYMNGLIETDSILNLLRFLIKNINAFNNSSLKGGLITKLKNYVIQFLHRNRINRAKENIKHHYDISNEFYKLMLDETMTYSGAIFGGKDISLKDAQLNKLNRILGKLKSYNVKNILDIGFGFGSFANEASKEGYNITGYTISEKQYDYAEKMLSDNKNVKLILDDYRNIKGKYDAVVSIGMLEHVGKEFIPIFFEKSRSLLNKDNPAIIQTIFTHNEFKPILNRKMNFCSKHIFPGSYLPNINNLLYQSEINGFIVEDIFIFGKDYAKTLLSWLNNFENNLEKVKLLGFDDKFIRMWRFYLCICAVLFENNIMDVMQMELLAV